MDNAYWIRCDLDGEGRKWRLAVDRGNDVYFPGEDFAEEMTLDEYREEFPGIEIRAIERPEEDGANVELLTSRGE